MFVALPSVLGGMIEPITTLGIGQQVPFYPSNQISHLMIHKGYEVSDGTGPTRAVYFEI